MFDPARRSQILVYIQHTKVTFGHAITTSEIDPYGRDDDAVSVVASERAQLLVIVIDLSVSSAPRQTE